MKIKLDDKKLEREFENRFSKACYSDDDKISFFPYGGDSHDFSEDNCKSFIKSELNRLKVYKKRQAYYRSTLKERYPWLRSHYSSVYRARIKKMEHNLTVEDFKKLWFRDNAMNLERPSIDRIDNKKGYIKGNCRYIELTENSRLGQIGKVVTEKQRMAGRLRRLENIRKGVVKPDKFKKLIKTNE